MNTVNTELRVVEYAQLFMPGALFSNVECMPLEGRTVQEVAMSCNPYVFAIATFKVLEGAVEVNGTSVKVASGHFDVSPRTYVGGVVYTLEEVKAMNMPGFLVANMEINGWTHTIRCLTGHWQPFEPEKGDTLLSRLSLSAT